MKRWLPVLLVLGLAACGSAPKKDGHGRPHGTAVSGHAGHGATAALPPGCTGVSPYRPAEEDPSTRGDYVAGGLYKPGVKDTTPDYIPNVDCIPEPLVVAEPRSPVGNRSPYTVLGKQYYVMDRPRGYVEQGIASYYGAKFHGRRTSNQEVYDMYAFTAAHKTLPLPSFARVTNLDNGKSVVVRVNDRGPFHDGRVIDLSYAAAVKLGIVARGTGRVEVRALEPGDEGNPVAAAPAGATRATGSGSAAVTSPATPATGLDQLVQALPSTTGSFAQAPVQVTPVATPKVEVATPAPVTGAATAAPAPASPGQVLQVASFSSLDNARRALERLIAAGIAGARLDDVVAGGRTMWRLRVAAGSDDAAELAGRIAGLGFGAPQLVRE
ncbi:septal ring lytic transglycosylase RlpA family protein [Pseudoxanthomonas suwonensis]|uniref:septal ring lytic transglycosylase RlpA family protein n=1 Tax=Pseudoxanthomonas suwonensis TaxID=314722 RepID=UPI00048D5760|nr:septal ring lytic transglycosylase RlpA family protein [Pseudoxanthomonas suwonensis]